MRGDKIAKFKNDWDATITGQTKALDEEEVLKPLLLRQLRRSSQLKEELMHYGRADPSSGTKAYAFVFTIAYRDVSN